jgi:hypothetical protein
VGASDILALLGSGFAGEAGKAPPPFPSSDIANSRFFLALGSLSDGSVPSVIIKFEPLSVPVVPLPSTTETHPVDTYWTPSPHLFLVQTPGQRHPEHWTSSSPLPSGDASPPWGRSSNFHIAWHLHHGLCRHTLSDKGIANRAHYLSTPEAR